MGFGRPVTRGTGPRAPRGRVAFHLAPPPIPDEAISVRCRRVEVCGTSGPTIGERDMAIADAVAARRRGGRVTSVRAPFGAEPPASEGLNPYRRKRSPRRPSPFGSGLNVVVEVKDVVRVVGAFELDEA